MKNSFFKRSVSLLLSFIICLSTIVGVALTASAASTTGKAIVIGYPRNGDTNYSTVTWGHDELHYMGGWMCHKGRYTTFYTMNSYKGIYSLNLLRKGGQRICLMVAVSISVGVAAVVVMNSCASVKRKPTPLGAKFGTVIISRSMRLSCGLSENMVIFVLLVK